MQGDKFKHLNKMLLKNKKHILEFVKHFNKKCSRNVSTLLKGSDSKITLF